MKGIENFAIQEKVEELKLSGMEKDVSEGNLLEIFERPSWVK